MRKPMKMVVAGIMAVFSGVIAVCAELPVANESDKAVTIERAGLKLTVEKTTGAVELSEIGGVKLTNLGSGAKPLVAAPTFNADQMEASKPELKWMTTVRKEDGRLVLSQKAKLDQKTAGLDLDGTELTREFVFTDSSIVTVNMKVENTTASKRYAGVWSQERLHGVGERTGSDIHTDREQCA